MIYFKLTDLLVFLEECRDEHYNPIEDIVGALNDISLTESERIKQVLAIFRYHGLKRVINTSEIYELKDILLFWQRQAKDNFSVIEAIVNLIEYKSKNLPDSEKDKVILDTLRKYGLFEIGYEGERNFLERKSPIPEPATKPEEDIQWELHSYEAQMELYNIRLLNAVVEFINFMN